MIPELLTFDLIVKSLIFIFGLKLVLHNIYRFISRDRTQTYSITFSVLILGLTLILLTTVPEIAGYINMKLGFGNNFNTLFFISFVTVFIVLIRLYKKIDEKERSISKVIREIAIRDAVKT